jgi:chaperonin GroEL
MIAPPRSVAGGGTSFIRALPALKKLRAQLEGDEQAGVDLVAEAIEVPLRTIADNAGEKGTVIVAKVKELKGNEGFNALTRQFGDLMKDGVITPAKVDRCALQNASSVASLLLATDCIITDKPQPADEAAGGHGLVVGAHRRGGGVGLDGNRLMGRGRGRHAEPQWGPEFMAPGDHRTRTHHQPMPGPADRRRPERPSSR